MKKTLIALAVLGAAAGVAHAQSNVTIYGIVDTGFIKKSGQDVEMGENVNNRLGFRGVEDLGSGMKATFQLERRFSLNNGTKFSGNNALDILQGADPDGEDGVEWQGAANVGLQGEAWGAVRLGRVNDIAIENFGALDPFAYYGVGSAMGGYNILYSEELANTIRYDSPSWAGFGFNLSYTLGQDTHHGNGSDIFGGKGYDDYGNDGFGIGLKYDNGPLMLTANYDRLAEKMSWLGIDPKSIRHILITHQDTDHVGAVEADSPGLFRNAKLYIGEIENRYLTGEVRRKVIYHLYKLPQVTINNEKVLLHDGQVLDIDGIKIECFLVPGHTWGHMVYLVDGKYLFTGDTLWFGADGGYSFISSLAEDNKLAVKSLALLEKKLRKRGLHPLFITGHTGWTDNMEFAFAHKNELCSPFKKRAHDPNALYDAYDESDDTEENSKSGYLKGVGR